MNRLADGLRAFAGTTSGPVYLVLVAVFFACLIAVSIHGGEFLTVDSIREMLIRSVALGIVAVGMTLVILGGSLDLSVAYVVSLASIVAAEVMADVVAALVAEHAGDASLQPVRIWAAHRIGLLEIGDPALVCAVSAAHRGQAFSVCSELVDRIKEQVPIWKEQFFVDGTVEWVGAGS